MRTHWLGSLTALVSVMVLATAATAAVPVSTHAQTAWPITSLPQAQSAAPASSATANNNDESDTSSGSVAVIPFTNISRDAVDDWIGDGIAETVIADLESLGSLTVIARERVRAVEAGRGGAEVDDVALATLGRELGARWIVTGGYQRLGSRLRITARMVDAASGLVSRTVKADGTLDEIFDLQDRIAAELTTDASPMRVAESSPDDRGGRSGIAAPRGEGSEPGVPSNSNLFGSAWSPGANTREPSPVTGGIVLPDGAPASRASRGRPGAADGVAPGARGGRPGAAGAAPGGLGTAESAGILTGRPSVTAVRTDDPPRIDGQLDDAVWQRATRLTEFVQVRPLDGAPATEETEVWVAFDSGNVYFAMHAHYSDPSIARANRVDRDQTRRDDTISVYFDTFLDQQRAYVFSVNGYGVQGDSLMGARGGGGRGRGGSRGGGGFSGGFGGVPSGDSSWDALFDSVGVLVADGWTAEMSIPFKSLRYPSSDSHRWGFQVARSISGKDETVVWSPVSRGNPSFMSQMGLLDGLSGLSTSRNLELLPTFTAVQVGSLDTGTGDFGEERQPEGALNLKYGITSNLTLDFTYNPDFSQIESDRPQIEVNQRFPLFFPELRPFFLEGQEVFQTRGPANLLHTRTIVDPRYGAKVTGKVGNTTVGMLYANDEAPGKVDDISDSTFGQTAQFLIGRARYDLYAESYVGAIVTDREFIDAYSRVGGVDANFRLGRTQSVSMSYFQSQHRDGEGVERSGPGWSFNYGNRGRNLTYSFSTDGLDPDFRTDTGFVRRVDTRQARASVSYRWYPESWILNWGPRASYDRNYNFEGILQDEGTNIGFNASFAKNINLSLSVNRDMERFAGINFRKRRYSAGGGINASRRIGVGGFFNWGDQIRFSATPFLGDGSSANIFLNLRPVSRFQSDLTLTTSRLVDPSTMQDVFDVKIYRAFSTYQFTERLLLRNIMEFNSFDRTLGANILLTYRVNSGTVFFLGYDDRYRQGDLIFDDNDDPLFFTTDFERTNRAFFTKLSYLFRY
ncbi:MAG: FlgO family outer membrane protein [Vicinamibacterales bacterium]|jgi:TolB-like protein|nr:FlgO family outer membrane protein [Vicinamibacterales bacterium]